MTNLSLITSNLVDHLLKLIDKSTSICWITAFAMKSGVKLVLPALKKAHDEGVELKLLVGDYLYITQPEALELLIDNLPNAEIRLYQSRGVSFHPKAYLFRQKDEQHVIVGSSNLSASALKNGVEWNIHVPSTVSEDIFDEAMEQFSQLFYSSQTIQLHNESVALYKEKYASANKEIPLSEKWDETEANEIMFGKIDADEVQEPTASYEVVISPRPAQQMALKALNETIEEGYDKALVVLATGLGKTYLAAFFAQRFNKILFVAHREEILQQAAIAFHHVQSDKTTGFYNANEKNKEADFLFASIHTLNQQYHLQQFDEDAFDLIIVDEFHHAAANSYKEVIDYFKPKFLLGITATPDRLDNKDVYSICDGNVAIRIHFIDAIQRSWLAPFEYFGVKDIIDYSNISWVGSGYDEQELLNAQLHKDVAEEVLKAWKEHKQTRTIAFCSSVKQSTYLANYFGQAGFKVVALSGTTPKNLRQAARQQLEKGEIDAIFTVDLFNEGVDIPKVDTLLFVRPTESLAIFTQQIGRGLRQADGKSHCTIIDLIGNYRNANLKLSVFMPDVEKQHTIKAIQSSLPDNCELHLETDVINLIEEMTKKHATYKQQIVMEFEKLKLELGKRPNYLEMHLQSRIVSSKIKQEFGSYIGLLHAAGNLNDSEEKVYQDYKSWLEEVESTGMNKSYKMVLLLAMLSRGEEQWFNPIRAEEVEPFFIQYLTEKTFRRKIDPIDSFINKVKKRIEDMPMTKWSGSSKGLVSFNDKKFAVTFDIPKEAQSILYDWTKQICTYRLHTYFEKKMGKIDEG